jgi:hypothetical protein
MAHLIGLPLELLSNIILRLDIQALRSISLASRILNILAQPVLFRTYSEAELRPDCVYFEDCRTATKLALLQFTVTVIRRPDLAACVKSIETEEGKEAKEGKEAAEEELFGPRPSELDIETLVQGVKDLRSSFESEWITGVQNVRTNDIILLLISKTLNLECLSIYRSKHSIERLLEFAGYGIKQQVKPTLGLLHCLKTLDLGDMHASPLLTLAPLLLLPSLEEFAVGYCVGDSDRDTSGALQLPPASCNIHTLVLKDCVFDVGSLNMLVTACKCLRVFDYGTFGDYESELHFMDDMDERNLDDLIQFTITDIFSALQVHQKHLEELRLGCGIVNDVQIPSTPQFIEFEKLKRVALDQTFHDNLSWLPDSLEVLCLTDPSWLSATDISEVKQNGLHSLKLLRVVTEKLDIYNAFIWSRETDERNADCLANEVREFRTELRSCGVEVWIERGKEDVELNGDLQVNSVRNKANRNLHANILGFIWIHRDECRRDTVSIQKREALERSITSSQRESY